MKWKPIYITGICCLAVGLVLCGAGVATGALNEEKYAESLCLSETESVIYEDISSVNIHTDGYAAVILQSGAGDTARVEATQLDDSRYDFKASVENGTLKISQREKSDNRYDNINMNFSGENYNTVITVTLPEKTYNSIAIEDCGECTVKDINADSIKIEADYGDCTLQGITAAKCELSSDNGDCTVSDCTVSGNLDIDIDYGDLTLTNTTAENISEIRNACGEVYVNNSSFGSCKIEVDYGNISIAATDIAKALKAECENGTATIDTLTCASCEIELDYGNLFMTDYTETDSRTKSEFEVSCGDMEIKRSTLYNAKISLDYGDIETTDTRLYGATYIEADCGNIDLNLSGSSNDYEIIERVSKKDKDKENTVSDKNIISIEQNVGDTTVDFTEN